MDGVIGNVVLHVFNPLHGVGIAVFVVAHQWQKFDAGIAVTFGNGGPLFKFAGGAVVGQVAHGDDDVGAQRLFFIQHGFHRVHGHVVAAALGIGQQADAQGGCGGGGAAFISCVGVVGRGRRIAPAAGKRKCGKQSRKVVIEPFHNGFPSQIRVGRGIVERACVGGLTIQ